MKIFLIFKSQDAKQYVVLPILLNTNNHMDTHKERKGKQKGTQLNVSDSSLSME